MQRFFGRNKRGRKLWACLCDCGAVRNVEATSLKTGVSRSCGCFHRDRASESNTTHGMTKGGKFSPEYRCWASMLTRCSNPNNKDWLLYGGRGITVCDRWHDFTAFFTDMGERPTPRHSIDRKDGDGNYEPDNCRWATPKEQARNWKSRNRLLTFNGETHPLSEWAERFNLKDRIIRDRLETGWSVESSLTITPVDERIRDEKGRYAATPLR